MATLVWTRGYKFPLDQLQSRLKCPNRGERRVQVFFEVPGEPRARTMKAAGCGVPAAAIECEVGAGAMCGRFTYRYTWSEIHALYRLTTPPANLQPRYNVCPTTTINTVAAREGRNELVPMRWGLIPSWWKKKAKETPATGGNSEYKRDIGPRFRL